jgi:hypothetical protein
VILFPPVVQSSFLRSVLPIKILYAFLKSARRKTATYTGKHKHIKHADITSMLRVEFEPTTPVLERRKIFRALDRAITVIV